jgi:tetratricopeptide (TPR) repeat protein
LRKSRGILPLIFLLLIVADLFVYASVRNHPLVNYDDPAYVGENAMVHGGLSAEGLAWAFTTDTQMNWHPLTWLSHMLDVQLFGMNLGMHHLTNLFFHIVNTLLLFWVFYRMTESSWRSAFVAALFGVHPAHVQSVAWVSERKDVLSTLFWLLTMLAYVAYARKPEWKRYLLVFAALALGLMAKPMLVTLPLILLLLDFWPLHRKGTLPRLILEKVPLMVLVAASSVVTFLVQSQGAVAKLENAPVGLRLQNALQSYLAYIGKMFWPADLALIYPYRFQVPAWQTITACIVLAGITFLAIWIARRRPYVFVGWAWYVVSLIPVIGLIQVGVQSMADRYTYIPYIGLFVAIAWMIPKHPAFAPAGIAVLVLLAIAARNQADLWRSSITLWRHTVNVTVDNPHARANLGNELLGQGRREEAVEQYLEVVRLDPRYLEAQYNLGIALMNLGRVDEASVHFGEALAIKPDYADAHNNLGLLLAVQRKPEEALVHYNEALRLNPKHVEGHSNIGVLLMTLGRTDDALDHFNEALRLDPSNARAHNNLAGALTMQGRVDDAIREYAEALRINPGYTEARSRLELLLSKRTQ